MNEISPLVKQARRAQVEANFSMLGRLINQSTSKQERGTILGMLACEIALRKKDESRALEILRLARVCFPDDYTNLKAAKDQEKIIRRVVHDEEFAQRIIDVRADQLHRGRL